MLSIANSEIPVRRQQVTRPLSSFGILLVFAASLVTLAGCFAARGAKSAKVPPHLAISDIAVGMSVQDFGSIFPGAVIPVSGQWSRPDEIHGLRGQWTYSFNRSHLSWFIFNSYEPYVTVDTFRRYLDATRKTITSFTDIYGRPDEIVRGVLVFKNPADGYPGYPVLKASWNTGSENLRVDYSVLGNGQEHSQLLFTVEYRR